ILDRLPRHLEEQSLLWIQHLRLAGRNVEEQRVELVDVVDEAAAILRRAPVLYTPFIAVRGDFVDAVSSAGEVVPQFSQSLRFRITTGHSDDGDVLFLPRR